MKYQVTIRMVNGEVYNYFDLDKNQFTIIYNGFIKKNDFKVEYKGITTYFFYHALESLAIIEKE